MSAVRIQIAVPVLALMLASGAHADPVDFARDVRPIFQKHCTECHGEKKQKSGLRLDVRAAAMKGGDTHGASIIAGKAQESPLLKLITSTDKDERMPPKGEGLPASEIATLTRWISEGAAWPDGVDIVKLHDKRDHWSFKPLAVADGAHSIDAFIDAKLAENGLHRSPPADPVSLIRRLSFDLTGLPPTPEETAQFLREFGAGENADKVIERTADRLLASPRYGERWAQHWLDVVRYADTHGFEVNTERPNAWPYRDYVIRAFNGDTPYDRFIKEQIVGDAMGEDAATGFLVTASVLLPGQIGKDEPSKRLARQDALDEIVMNIGQTFLGLSVGCARCHDHKFDPIPQRDYYAMQAFVAGVEYADREMRPADADSQKRRAKLSPDEKGGRKAKDKAVASGEKAFAGRFREPDEIRLLHRGDPEQPKDLVSPAVLSALGTVALADDIPEQGRRAALAEWIASPQNPLTARVMVNRIWQGHFGTGLVETPSDFGLNGRKPTHPELLDWLAQEFIRGGWSVKHMHRLIVMSQTYRQSSVAADGRRRADLERGTRNAERGKNNAAGDNLFDLHVPSSASESARLLPSAATVDADARLLWHFPPRRLEAEVIRDSMLAVSGRLDLKMFGRGFDFFDKRGGLSGFKPVESFTGDGLRRMIYGHKVRREREAVFGSFDCPDAGQSTARRRESTTPIQALNLFNSRFTLDESDALAARVKREAGDDPAQQIRRTYELALSREPSAPELSDAGPVIRAHGLATLSRALFNSNEFLFLP